MFAYISLSKLAKFRHRKGTRKERGCNGRLPKQLMSLINRDQLCVCVYGGGGGGNSIGWIQFNLVPDHQRSSLIYKNRLVVDLRIGLDRIKFPTGLNSIGYNLVPYIQRYQNPRETCVPVPTFQCSLCLSKCICNFCLPDQK